MASEAAARRREARVRKILGNMDDRLMKISGSQYVEKQPIPTTTFTIRPDPPIKEKCVFEEKQPDATREIFTQPRLSEPKETPSVLQRLFADHQIHVAVVAVVTFIILRTHASFLIYESVMVPFYTLVFGKLVLGNRNSGSNSSLIFSLLSLYAAKSKVTSTILEIFSVVASISRDLCLYLFIIILASVLFGY